MSYHLSSAAMRQTKSLRRNHNTVRVRVQRAGLGPIANILLLALILSVMGLLYLAQFNKTSSFGYQINELKSQKATLLEENQALKVESARLQALERIKTSDVAKSLKAPNQVDYLNN